MRRNYKDEVRKGEGDLIREDEEPLFMRGSIDSPYVPLLGPCGVLVERVTQGEGVGVPSLRRTGLHSVLG